MTTERYSHLFLIFDGGDQPTSANVLDLLDLPGSIVQVTIDSDSLLIYVGSQFDVLIADSEADVM